MTGRPANPRIDQVLAEVEHKLDLVLGALTEQLQAGHSRSHVRLHTIAELGDYLNGRTTPVGFPVADTVARNRPSELVLALACALVRLAAPEEGLPPWPQ